MKRVALELQPCCWARSGIGLYTYELARRLKDTEDFEFSGNIFNFLGRRDLEDRLEGIEFPIRMNRLFPYGVYRRVWDWAPLPYHCFFPKADVTVFFNFIVPPRVAGQTVAIIHDLTYLRYPETMSAANLKHIPKGIERSIVQSGRVVATSNFTKGELMTLLGVAEDKISVVNSAPSLSDEFADLSAVRNKYGIGGEYILFVGTIEPRKNISRLLTAYDMLKERYKIPHQLVLAGGKGWRDEGIFETFRSMRHRDDVVLTGYVSDEEKNTLYQNASVFVFPSVYEGFGMPPLEAMTRGCPVVCADAASLPEIAGGAAELVDPMDAVCVAEGIARVLFDEERAAVLRTAGFERAKHYTWENAAVQFLRMLDSVPT